MPVFVDQYFPRRVRCACGQNGSPAKNVAPTAMTPTAASTLLRPSQAQYTSSRSSNSASSSTTSAVADPYAIATAGCELITTWDYPVTYLGQTQLHVRLVAIKEL